MGEVRGVSILEVIMAIFLAGLLLAVGVANLRHGQAGAGSRALAESLAEELREARKLAVASHIPVAVGFPSAGGSLAHFQSLYRYQEEDRPRLTQVRNFGGDFPGCCIFLGSWGAAGETATQPTPVSNQDGFSLAQWPNPVSAQDPSLVFTPAGTVKSTNLPVFGGNFHLGISSGLTYSGGTPGNWLSFRASRACSPFTVTVSPLGQVWVEPGLVGSSGVTVESRAIAVNAVAAPPALAFGGNTAPTIDRLTVAPDPPVGSPAGSTLVDLGGHLTLKTEARDANGDRLYCSWSGPGTFSSAARDRMEWNSRLSPPGWISTWAWCPPETDPGGTVYDLTCTVRDQRGAVVTGGANGQLHIISSAPTRVLYRTQLQPGSIECLGQVNLSGSQERIALEHRALSQHMEFSPDGSKIAFQQSVPGGFQISVCNADGSGLRKINSGVAQCMEPSASPTSSIRFFSWSPMGDRLAYGRASSMSSQRDIYTVRPDGSGDALLVDHGGLDDVAPLWTPDGKYILYRSGPVGNRDIWLKQATPGGADFNLSALLPTGSAADQNPLGCVKFGTKWRILYIDFNFSMVPAQALRVIDLDPSTLPVSLTAAQIQLVDIVRTPGAVNPSGRLSPDGLKISYQVPSDVYVWQIGLAGPPETGIEYRITNSPLLDQSAVWSRDATRIVFMSETTPFKYELKSSAWNGGPVKQLTTKGVGLDPGDCSPR